MTYNFEQLNTLLKTARDGERGKPIAHNTRVYWRASDAIAIRHHNTDIVTCYEDGRMKVAPWNSASTKARIHEYAGVQLFNYKLPCFNGRLPFDIAVPAFCRGSRWDPQPAPLIAARDHVMFRPDGEVDLDSVSPYTFTVVTDRKKLNEALRKTAAILDQLKILLMFVPQTYGTMDFNLWLKQSLPLPLNEIDYHAPYNTFQRRSHFLASEHETLALLVDAARRVELKILPTTRQVITLAS